MLLVRNKANKANECMFEAGTGRKLTLQANAVSKS
jgi:hypothetical protein